MRTMLAASLGLVALAAAGCGRRVESAPEITEAQRSAAKRYMNQAMEEAASSVWNAIGYTSDPVSEETWADAREQALTLAALAEELETAPFAYDDDAWVEISQALAAASENAARAAEAHDADAFYLAGDQILATCEPCHVQYLEPLRPAAP